MSTSKHQIYTACSISSMTSKLKKIQLVDIYFYSQTFMLSDGVHVYGANYLQVGIGRPSRILLITLQDIVSIYKGTWERFQSYGS